MSWHIDSETLDRYATGTATSAAAASAEAHLTGCADCRALLAPAVEAPRLDAIWAEVDRRVDLSSRPLAERLLTRAGVREDTARLLAVTPSLRGAWLASILVAAALAAAAAHAADGSGRGMVLFLTLAPLLPVAGVALSYGPATDPAYELTLAAPYSVLRLVLLRTVAVVTCTVAITALGAAGLADNGWRAVAWLLPALALSAATLALSVRTTPTWASAAVGTAWLCVVLASQRSSADALVFGAPGQLAALLLLAGAVLALLRLRSRFSYDTRRSS
jgi:hypothetical protein